MEPHRVRRTSTGVSALLVALASCGGESEQSAPVPGSLTLEAGDGQAGVVGTALPTSLTVRVRDRAGTPLAGVSVVWSVVSGRGSLSASTTSSAGDGRATATWTLGGAVGPQSVQAAAAGFSATFTATAEAGPPAQVAVTPPASTLDAIADTVRLAAEVQDAFGNGLAGSVAWASADDAVVTVDSTGLATAVANGTADAVATFGSLEGTAALTVAQAAATLRISPPAPVTVVDSTVQLTATGEDANGFEVAGLGVTWASADGAVVAIDSTGLVTALAEGQAWVRAAAGSATDSVRVTVTGAPFEPASDTEISGDLSAATIAVPAGVTVTLTAAATLSSAGPVDIAGTLRATCLAATVAAGGALTVTGTISNACGVDTLTAPGADLRLSAAGAITLDGAVITSDGDIVIDNTGEALGAPRTLLGPPGGSRRAAGAGLDCPVNETVIGPSADAAAGGTGSPKGGDGRDGGDVRLVCGGDMTFTSARIFTQAGGRGGQGNASGGATAEGGAGGRGGDVLLQAAGAVIFARDTGPATTIILGGGGGGGMGRAEGESPVSVGGAGARTGLPTVVSRNSFVEVREAGAVTLAWSGVGGRGGDGVSLADDGADATAQQPPEPGFPARARGGAGGALGYPDRTTDVLGDLFQGNVVGGEHIVVTVDPGDLGGGRDDMVTPGLGGNAIADGGAGGAGSKAFKDGAQGGAAHAVGGDAGHHTLFDSRSGSLLGLWEPGGNAIFGNGRGGKGWADCQVGSVEEGGRGGDGGPATGSVGEGTPLDGAFLGFRQGWVNFWNWSNGGNGGDGRDPGQGGSGGTDEVEGRRDSSNDFELGFSFVRGEDGSPCETPVTLGVSVRSDPNEHAPFIELASGQKVTVQLGLGGRIVFSGPAPWVRVEGTVDQGGNFSTNGTGTVAGFTGVSVTFEGTLALDDENRVVGIREGTLTMDATNSVLPEDGDGNRNPAIYDITGVKSEG